MTRQDALIKKSDVFRILDEIQTDVYEGEGYQHEKWVDEVNDLPEVDAQPVIRAKGIRHYEKHIDHTDCIWYGSDNGCPVTCSQYRDGWNDAMDYIFKNGKGYQPYRHDG